MWFPVWTSACMPPSKERLPDVSKAIVEAEGRSNVTKLDAELRPQNRSLTVLVSNMLEFINIFSASSLCAQKGAPSVGLA